MKKISLPLFVLTLILVGFQTSTAQINQKDIANFARNFYFDNFDVAKKPINIIDLNNTKQQNFAINFEEGGYVLIHKNQNGYIVDAVITEGKFDIQNNHFINQPQLAKLENISHLHWQTPRAHSQNRSVQNDIGNFVTCEWGSVNCIDDQNNIVDVSNYYTPSNCSAGCVAISTSQILDYFNWPIIGVGNNVYNDNYNGSLVRHGAFFDKEPYDWANMLDRYMYVNSTDTQRSAVGKLVYDVAVAVEMDFEPDGSSSNVNNVPFILANYFRYTGHYENASSSGFWSDMYQSMQNRIPVPLAIEKTNHEGHAVIATGYKYMNGAPYYYINWGWYNTGSEHNGWYNIQGWDSSRPGYNTILGGILDMIPEPQITNISPSGTGNDFSIHWDIARNTNYEEYTLERKIDNGSWQTVATGITGQDYQYDNPTGQVYQFRVKGKINGGYYLNSWSEIVVYTPQGGYNGYGEFNGSQNCYARQTPNYDLIFNHDYTFETWINLHSGNQNGDVILDQEYLYAFEIEDVTSIDYSVVFESPASQDALHSNQSGAKLQIGQWHHIAVSTIGNTTRLFVDGVERDSNPNNHFHLNSSNVALNIGQRYHSGYSGFIKADFDQMRLSNSGRYNANFSPEQNIDFVVDQDTKAYFKFQNVHRNRLKDEAFHVSVIASNTSGNVQWNFDYDPNGSSAINEALFSKNLSVYPNPTTDFINIHNTSPEINLKKINFEIYNLNGKQIPVKIKHNNNDIQIDMRTLPTGSYILIAKGNHFKANTQILKK